MGGRVRLATPSTRCRWPCTSCVGSLVSSRTTSRARRVAGRIVRFEGPGRLRSGYRRARVGTWPSCSDRCFGARRPGPGPGGAAAAHRPRRERRRGLRAGSSRPRSACATRVSRLPDPIRTTSTGDPAAASELTPPPSAAAVPGAKARRAARGLPTEQVAQRRRWAGASARRAPGRARPGQQRGLHAAARIRPIRAARMGAARRRAGRWSAGVNFDK